MTVCARPVKGATRSSGRAGVERLARENFEGTTGTDNREAKSAGGVRAGKDLVRLEGIEPPTLGLEVRRSIQLSYRRIEPS